MRTKHNENTIEQFKQVVESFFKVHPEKEEKHLLTYVELKSNLDYDTFCEWRKNKGNII